MLINIYKIQNLSKIKIKYRLYRIRGLLPDAEDFDKSVQQLSDKLSRTTRSPCIAIKEKGELFIAQPMGYRELPIRLALVGSEVIIELTQIERVLSCASLNDADMRLAIRFLQFDLQGHLHDIPSLWQPSTGQPYFQKNPDQTFPSRDVVMYRGFKVRLIQLPGNEVGVCVDVTRKYASRHYLPSKITPDEFRKLKGKRCIYEFGHRWYEIRITGISGLNVSDERIDEVTLLDYVKGKTKDPKPQALLSLPRDCTVLTYQTASGPSRLPSALCRITYSTEHPAVKGFHQQTIIPPYPREREIDFVVRSYLSRWIFQGILILLSSEMLKDECEVLTVPDIEFGNNRVLSVRRTQGAVPCTLEELGPQKRSLIHSPDAGFYVVKPLDRQYLIMPKSMYQTFGKKYVQDLKSSFNKLFAHDREIPYDPIIITYDDSVRQSIYTLGSEILRSVSRSIGSSIMYQGYGLVIVPRLNPTRQDKEEELASLLMRELREKGIYVSISHTEIPSASYNVVQSVSGQPEWHVIEDERIARKFRGYMENVVLNKILLLNHCWPFVLSQPLNSDLVIGLDVKNNTAGFTVIMKDGRTFSFTSSDSDQKEQLSRGHVSTVLYAILRRELDGASVEVRDVTVHRDGKVFDGEKRGIFDALNKLARDGLVDKDYNCNFVEIKKSSRIPVRFFNTIIPQGSMQERIENPRLGTYKIFGDNAFLCTTGRPYRYNGTTQPLQVVKIEGTMEFKLILDDLFALSNLTWTKPDYCSRLPISIKMTDIRLREVAGEYDENSLRFLEEEVPA